MNRLLVLLKREWKIGQKDYSTYGLVIVLLLFAFETMQSLVARYTGSSFPMEVYSEMFPGFLLLGGFISLPLRFQLLNLLTHRRALGFSFRGILSRVGRRRGRTCFLRPRPRRVFRNFHRLLMFRFLRSGIAHHMIECVLVHGMRRLFSRRRGALFLSVLLRLVLTGFYNIGSNFLNIDRR